MNDIPQKEPAQKEPSRCGYVAIVGRPNVGKSTLLNHMLGQKLSITSRKPQTTQHSLLGIKTFDNTQCIFVDTPGLHRDHKSSAVNRHMNRSARSVIDDVDLVLFMVDRTQWGEEEEWIASLVDKSKAPVFLVINKTDLLADRAALLPFLEKIGEKFKFQEYVPIAALNGEYLDQLQTAISEHLPEGEFHFPDDQITDKSERFMVAEIIREKLIRQLGRELPYATAVEIEHFKVEKGLHDIAATILVERSGQKAIIIGKGGSRLQKIGSQARVDLENMFEQKVMLRLWVKVKQGWSNDERALKSLGFDD
ncbi:MAG: GTPase Era [Pseudomonadales bacterium]